MIKNRGIKSRLLVGVIAISLIASFSGCGGGEKLSDTKIVLTTGFDKDEVFRIEKTSCRLPEVMVYLTNMQNRYENTFGDQIWNASYEGVSLQDNVKETVLARIAQIKTMNLMAEEQQITLSDSEIEKANLAGTRYYESLNANEIEALGVDEALLQKMYEEYALANKVYQALIADINPEISDDEARTITVQQILFRTYYVDNNGNKIAYDDGRKAEIYQRAKEAYQRAEAGEDFSTLISEYSDDEVGTYSFGKGKYDKDFEDAAFLLGTNEISNIVETPYGYHIIKCISTFNKEETDINKQKIVEERRKEVFNEQYSEFVSGLTRNLNEELWEQVTFLDNEQVTTASFFDIYQELFPAEI